jgi:hypothetical protein
MFSWFDYIGQFYGKQSISIKKTNAGANIKIFLIRCYQNVKKICFFFI